MDDEEERAVKRAKEQLEWRRRWRKQWFYNLALLWVGPFVIVNFTPAIWLKVSAGLTVTVAFFVCLCATITAWEKRYEN